MRAHDELELKLIVPSEFQIPKLLNAGASVTVIECGPPLDMTATYFDTPDYALLNHGITFRHRTGEDEGALWTLKLPVTNDPALRRELEYADENGSPPREALDLLFGVLAGASLAPVAEIKTKRWKRNLVDEEQQQIAELVDDRVSILDGSVIRDSYREIEIESRGADRDRLQQIADAIEDGGGEPDQRSKLARALHVLRPNGWDADERSVKPSPDDPAQAAVEPALMKALQRFVSNDPYARLGDVEGVHQLRVAARRLRSVLRTFAPLIPEERSEPIVNELRLVGHALGGVRDLDVMLEEVQTQSEGTDGALTPVIDTLSRRRDVARVEAMHKLNSPEYIGLIHNIGQLASQPLPEREEHGPIKEVLPGFVRKAWRKMRNAARALTLESPEEEFHRARILSKRARYAAETVAPFTGKKQSEDIRAFAVLAEKVQNVLGEHQDAAVSRDTLASLAENLSEGGKLQFWLGRIVERENQRANARRKQFFDLWNRLEGKKQHKWLSSN